MSTLAMTEPTLLVLHRRLEQTEAELAELYREQTEADYDADPGLLYSLPAQIRCLEARREHLRHAYERARQGQHRFCEDCGQLISPERLEAYPEATRCIACARAAERHPLRRLLLSPMGSPPRASPPRSIPLGA
ncbi:MAG: TraR/DksA C4-type zinc finger protein [Anaerolineae bacterium]|nr:TraR/DksA C4-type zinc finger protein [Anaerolineae bacterium]